MQRHLLLSAGLRVPIHRHIALASHGSPPWYSLAVLTAVGALIALGARHLTRHRTIAHSAARILLTHVNRVRRRPAAAGLPDVYRFIEQLGAARLTAGHGVAAATHAMLNWILDAVCLYLCFHAVSQQPINPAQVLLAFCAGMAAGTLTIIPGGLGIIGIGWLTWLAMRRRAPTTLQGAGRR